jgi:hypothetical protein
MTLKRPKLQQKNNFTLISDVKRKTFHDNQNRKFPITFVNTSPPDGAIFWQSSIRLASIILYSSVQLDAFCMLSTLCSLTCLLKFNTEKSCQSENDFAVIKIRLKSQVIKKLHNSSKQQKSYDNFCISVLSEMLLD